MQMVISCSVRIQLMLVCCSAFVGADHPSPDLIESLGTLNLKSPKLKMVVP
ncbi:hypothetical protein PF008_g13308 [Phytophthora fragariae]|uniref:RxLR effector protein n=1 Tax=Phytophthora fragariae TaxID=53985 RepID=A0A6G0RL60_9STRA|nr:hypothetical protein PF008_g13308 [Phytophthora fragariae]